MKDFILLGVIYFAFVSLGLPDGVLGLAWPSMRASMGQPLEALGMVTVLLTCCSAVSGFMSGRVLSRFGTGPVTFASALMTGLSLLGFSLVPGFPLIVALAVPLGLGAGSVDAGLNHFVAEHYSSRHMNWLHACWGVGATLGPLIMGTMLTQGSGWRGGYQIIASCQLTFASLILLSLGLWKYRGKAPHDPEKIQPGESRDVSPWAPVLAAALFALYSAVEIGTGLWAASILIESRGIEPGTAGLALTLYYGSIMGGRVVIGFVSERVGNRPLIRYGLLVAVAGIVILAFGRTSASGISGLVLAGFGCSPVYPALMHETPRRFDPATARKVIGWQVAAANLGAALMPAAFGLLAARAGLEAVFPAIGCFALALFLSSQYLDKVTGRKAGKVAPRRD